MVKFYLISQLLAVKEFQIWACFEAEVGETTLLIPIFISWMLQANNLLTSQKKPI